MNRIAPLEFFWILISGAVTGICFWPGNYGWMFWFVFVPFFWVILKKDWQTAFCAGWLFGVTAWLSGMYWFVAPFLKFLNVNLAKALPPLLVVFAWHGLMFALPAGALNALSSYFSKRLGWSRGTVLLLTAAPVMAATERFFPMLFPVYFANTQYFHLPQVQILEVFGPAGLVWLTMGFNAAAYLLAKALWARKTGRGTAGSPDLSFSLAVFGALCGLVLINECYGELRIGQIDRTVSAELARGHSLNVSIIQGSVPADDAGTPAVYERLTGEALKTAAPDLVLWPESVYNRTAGYEITNGPSGKTAVFEPGFARVLKAELPFRTALLMGTLGRTAEKPGLAPSRRGGKRNIAFITGPDRELLGLVEKRYLFPFGEYIPLGGAFPVLYRLFPYSDDVSAGGASPPIYFGNVRAGVVICYEDLYTEASRKFSEQGANVLFNITNEARFGYHVSPEQHLAFSALRAIENRRFFIRAVNTGISAVIDPAGRITKRMAVKERGALNASVQLLERLTFYSEHGDFLCFFGILLIASFALMALISPKSSDKGEF